MLTTPSEQSDKGDPTYQVYKPGYDLMAQAFGGIMSLTPAEGGWRAVVVDTADEMNRHAANALLKILEEPPARALVILVSHSPGRLLPTIVSRCRRLPLQALADDDVSGRRKDAPTT